MSKSVPKIPTKHAQKIVSRRKCIGIKGTPFFCKSLAKWPRWFPIVCQKHKWQWWTGFLALCAIVGLFGTYFSGYSWWFGATTTDVQQATNKIIQGQQESTDNIVQNLQGIHKLLRETLKTSHSELKEKYPLGYVLFYTDGRRLIAPMDARVTNVFELDFTAAGISSWSQGEADIIMPNIVYRPRGIHFFRPTTGVYRREGYRLLYLRDNKSGTDMWLEVLVNREDYMICAIGFKRSQSE